VGLLSADAAHAADRRFKFILTHVGTNRNGDHFTPGELREAAKTAVGKKIDLSHSQEFRDIVGGIVEAKYVEAGDASRVECVGELFTDESEPARLAYKLMKRGIVGHVSMECDYQEGECSVCGKKVKSKAEYCVHLKNYKGRAWQGKPVYEILHGITFTGMGLLDREGADEKAEIRQVAAQASANDGGSSMGDETKKKTQGQDEPVDPAELSDAEKVKLIKKQQAEIERLTRENEGLQKKLDDSQAAHKAIVRKAKAETLLKQWEEAGRAFENDEAKTAELERLMKLSDEGFDATEAAVQAFAAGKKKKPDDEEDPADGDDEEEDGKKPLPFGPKKKKPKKQAGLNADAGRSGGNGGMPSPSPDQKGSLAEKLTAGFMAAWKDRAGNDA
jgi:adenine-specific DNA-methyltransferase